MIGIGHAPATDVTDVFPTSTSVEARKPHVQAQAQATLAAGSKSFRLAARLLSPRIANDAAVCYAWCRRADDLVDETTDPTAGVQRLNAELDVIYSRETPTEWSCVAFQELVRRRGIPRAYAQALIDGFAMDAQSTAYDDWATLELYAYRVAGVVGLMMTHVLGVHDDRCLPAAARLGLAMQLTNISRDVVEDWGRGRLYIPEPLLGGQMIVTGARPPEALRGLFSSAVATMLARARRYYHAARVGFLDLPWRSALAIRVAALVYAEIGREIEKRQCDVFAGRAIVSPLRKAWLVCRAFAGSLGELPARAMRRWRRGPMGDAIPSTHVRFPDDVVLGD